MKTEINEKTLELNVISSLLESARKNFPKAYSMGFSLWNERIFGLDSGIDISRTFRFLLFQFKKPYKIEGNTYWFRFNNNKRRDQHDLLCEARIDGARIGGASNVFYAFPLFENLGKVYEESPNFLKRTYVADPLAIGVLPDSKIHEIAATFGSDEIVIHSEWSKKIKVESLDKILEKFLKNKEGIINKDFLFNLRSYVSKSDINFFKNLEISKYRKKYNHRTKIQLRGIAI